MGRCARDGNRHRSTRFGPGGGRNQGPNTGVGTFTLALYDESKKKGWTVISMKNDWKKVAARYSSIDFTSGPVEGGKFYRLSGALSWYPTSQWRFEFNYGYGRLNRAGLQGRTNFYQLRLQFRL